MKELDLLVPQNDECCGNCAYWYGQRKIHSFFGRASVPCGEDGECGKYYRGLNMPSNGSCPEFERHPAIKKLFD